MATKVKICGISEAEHIVTAAEAGAAYIGLMFFEKSPRNVTLDQARALALKVPAGTAKVGVTVNASDEFLARLTKEVPLDFLQLHGQETPERVAKVRERFSLPVIKAIGIADQSDLPKIDLYGEVADQLLVDAKAPKDAPLTGGNGLSFDWKLIADREDWPKPWMLAGGLTPDNVAQAVAMTGALQVDLSSGVETSPGVKNSGLIRRFMKAALG